MQTKLGKSARVVESKERGWGMISRCVTRIQANAQGTQYAEWIMPPRSQISLYCPNSAAEAAAISSSELYSGKLSVPRRALASLPGCYIPTRIHVRARARAYTSLDPRITDE